MLLRGGVKSGTRHLFDPLPALFQKAITLQHTLTVTHHDIHLLILLILFSKIPESAFGTIVHPRWLYPKSTHQPSPHTPHLLCFYLLCNNQSLNCELYETTTLSCSEPDCLL